MKSKYGNNTNIKNKKNGICEQLGVERIWCSLVKEGLHKKLKASEN